MEAQNLADFWTENATESAMRRWIDAGLREDEARGDTATAALFGPGSGRARATIVAEEPGVFCGGPAAVEVFRSLDGAATEISRETEGTLLACGAVAVVVEADVAAVLSGERTALNILGHLSGIASESHRWVKAAPGVTVLDTRKTLPGLRRFQKFAVRCGGATNHRGDLAEFPMIKENHRRLFAEQHGVATPPGKEIDEILVRVRAHTNAPVEIEVEDYESFEICLRAGVELILLDNQTPEVISEWIARAREAGLAIDAQLEASGGISRESAGAFAGSGVTRISVGALTHSVRAMDYSLDVCWVDGVSP